MEFKFSSGCKKGLVAGRIDKSKDKLISFPLTCRNKITIECRIHTWLVKIRRSLMHVGKSRHSHNQFMNRIQCTCKKVLILYVVRKVLVLLTLLTIYPQNYESAVEKKVGKVDSCVGQLRVLSECIILIGSAIFDATFNVVRSVVQT